MLTAPGLLLLALVATVGSTTAEFDAIDTNDDGRVSSSEHEVYARKLFDEMDTDGDYKLSVAEIMVDESKFTRHVYTAGNPLRQARGQEHRRRYVFPVLAAIGRDVN